MQGQQDQNTALMLRGMESIGRKVDKIDEDIQYVKGELVRNEEWHNVLNKSVQDIHEAVHGNGKQGLSQEIKCLDDTIGEHSEEIQSLKIAVSNINTTHKEEDTLQKAARLEWLKGWRAVFFTLVTTILTVTATLLINNYLNRPPIP